MVHTFIGNLGHFFVITSFVTAILAAFSFFKANAKSDLHHKVPWLKNGRTLFYIHFAAIIGVVGSLFFIIYNHYYEYHYAWSHSSLHLPTQYMISCFWEGQEGSFLLWMFWQAAIGVVLIRTNKFWEAPVMTVFSLVQTFLASMILGVVIFNLKIGSTPFILLRDFMINAPVFQINPDFIPEDGTGLNALLQNYWMVIHPPTLFLGFATTLVPFAFCISGIWNKKYKEWIRPALPWTIFSAAVLGLGILMGGYWAYETLNFGGYWNWDPVENAVYIPWLFLIASIHTMITFKNSATALKSSIVLVIITFILILYSTFLTRSGILGDASVHSFTDLGLSGQLLIYLLFFTVGAVILSAFHWKNIPTSTREASTYSREFWIFIGATTLGLMSFQVLIPTSIPVFNKILQLIGIPSQAALPADQIQFFTTWQKWFAIAVLLLSGTGQFFWWKKMEKAKLYNELIGPISMSLIISAVIILISGISNLSYILLLTASIYSIIANGKIIYQLSKNNISLSGGGVAHIGIAMMLIGILTSSGYSRVVTTNATGTVIHPDFTSEFNLENVLLVLNETKNIGGYTLKYKGQRMEAKGIPGYVKKNDLGPTDDPFLAFVKKEISANGKIYASKGDTVEIYPENTYYEVEYVSQSGKRFTLYPRAQINEDMGGILASPDIHRRVISDLYAHVSSIPDPTSPVQWDEMKEIRVKAHEKFFVNDYVSEIESMERITEVEGVALGPADVAVKARIKILGDEDEYELEPIFLIKDRLVGRIPAVEHDLGIKITFLEVHPDDNEFTLGLNTTQKDYVILKAMEKPFINILWSGTFILMFGFGIAIYRRYKEFTKIRDKEKE